MSWAAFGLFIGGVVSGMFGSQRRGTVKRDKLAPKDDEAGRNRRARNRVRKTSHLPTDI